MTQKALNTHKNEQWGGRVLRNCWLSTALLTSGRKLPPNSSFLLSPFQEEDEGSRSPASWEACNPQLAQRTEISSQSIPRAPTEPAQQKAFAGRRGGGHDRGSAQWAGEEKCDQREVRAWPGPVRGGSTVQCARPRGRAVWSTGGEGPAGASVGRCCSAVCKALGCKSGPRNNLQGLTLPAGCQRAQHTHPDPGGRTAHSCWRWAQRGGRSQAHKPTPGPPRAPTQHSWGQPLRDHPQILLQTDCQRCDCNHLSTFQMKTVQAYMKGYSGMHGVDIDRNQFPNPWFPPESLLRADLHVKVPVAKVTPTTQAKLGLGLGLGLRLELICLSKCL